MDDMRFPSHRLGIVGGGQLGKMLAQEAKKLSISVSILDPSHNPPAAQVADQLIVGSFFDEAGYRELADSCDVITCELENIDTEMLEKIAAAGHAVYPKPATLKMLQDKLKQKEFFVRNQLPTARFSHVEGPDEAIFNSFGYPLVQKSRRGGYDGRGVKILKSSTDFDQALKCDSILEKLVEVDKELAVIVARGKDGEVAGYPVVEMLFDTNANILDLLMTPARISAIQSAAAKELAIRAIQALNGVGVFGVEMFLTRSGKLLINEISPRPHNSGHYTIEACMTSQYGQHLRAITGLPLGSTELLSPVVMVNLLGTGKAGKPILTGLHQALAIPGATVHLYGKETVNPDRKMGHTVILDRDLDAALKKAQSIKHHLKIFGE